MNIRFLTVPGEVAARWHQIAPLLAPVIEEAAFGELTLDDIRALAEARCMYIGVCEYGGVPTMAMAFEFRRYPQMTALNVVALGGSDLDSVADRFFPKFKEWAAQAGAKRIEASCSKAMARLLKRYGFSDTYELVSLAV